MKAEGLHALRVWHGSERTVVRRSPHIAETDDNFATGILALRPKK